MSFSPWHNYSSPSNSCRKVFVKKVNKFLTFISIIHIFKMIIFTISRDIDLNYSKTLVVELISLLCV